MQGKKMNTESWNTIQSLYQALEEHKNAQLRKKHLHEQRQELDQHIRQLQSNLESSLFKKDKNSEESLEADQRMLDNLKQKRQEIDHSLDLIEDDLEDLIDTHTNSLVGHLLNHFPKEELRYQAWTTHIKEQGLIYQEFHAAFRATREINDLLEEALAIRRATKKRGLIQYVFGRSPSSTISKYLQKIESSSPKAKKDLESLLASPKLSTPQAEMVQETIGLLKDLELESGQEWSGKKLDQFYESSLEQLQHLLKQHTQTTKEIEQSIEKMEQEIANWIHKLCQAQEQQSDF